MTLVMAAALCVPAFAATGDIDVTFDLTSGGKNDIVVKTGDVITVSYKLSADENATASVTQNEIYYDHTFFQLVEGSNEPSTAFSHYTTSLQERLDGKRYVYFNTMTTCTYTTTPAEIGTFRLKVIATSGESTVANVNMKAEDSSCHSFGIVTKNLHVSIGEPLTPKFKVVFSNGSGGVHQQYTVESGNSVTIPSGPAKSGYTFSYWSISGDSKQYLPTQSYTPTHDVTFNPNWTKDSTPSGGGSSGGSSGGGSGSGSTSLIIKATAGSGGSISPSGNVSVKSGSDKTFKISAATGYQIEDVLVDGKSVGAVSSYTFENVKKDHTIYAAFKLMGGSKNPFVDVPEGAYFEDAVIWASENGITSGRTANTFDPYGVCTRAHAVTFLWRAAGSPAPVSDVMPFTDVPVGSYYYDAVLWAMEMGITVGTTDTTFSPDQYCTRAHIVTFLWRAQGKPASSAVNVFTDVAANAYYTNAVLWAVENGITLGTTATTFSPNVACTRAQIVTFLYRSQH